MENETKREKFVRLAENRTNKILDTLQLLGNCANQNVYEYSKKDVEKIFNAIQMIQENVLINKIAKKMAISH